MQLTSVVHSQLLTAFLKNTVVHCEFSVFWTREREREREDRRRNGEMEREESKRIREEGSVFT